MTRRTLYTRVVILAAFIFVGALVSSWFLVERLISGPVIKLRIEAAASKFLQHPLTIGDLKWHRWPKWNLVGQDVRLWEDSSKTKLLFELSSLEAHLSLLSLPRMTGGLIQLIRGRRNLASLNPVFAGKVNNPPFEVDFKIAIKEAPRFTATIDLKNARYHSTMIPQVQAVVHKSEEGGYTLERTEFQGLGGSVALQGSFLPSASTDSLKITWETAGVQAEDLFRLAGSSAEVSGQLDSDGHIESGTGIHFIPSMHGEIKVNLKNGWFGNATGLLKILSKLNLTTLITKTTGEHRSRVPFDQTHGTIKIGNGIASTVEPIVLENKTLQMAFMGSYDLHKKSVDGKVVVNVLMVTDEIINLIPFVRKILLGDKKGLTPIWFSVKGSAADPDIRILSGKSIASPVWNIIANIFRLPSDLIQKVRGK